MFVFSLFAFLPQRFQPSAGRLDRARVGRGSPGSLWQTRPLLARLVWSSWRTPPKPPGWACWGPRKVRCSSGTAGKTNKKDVSVMKINPAFLFIGLWRFSKREKWNHSPSVPCYSHSCLVHYNHVRQVVCGALSVVFGCLLTVHS